MQEIQKKVQTLPILYDKLDKINKQLDFQESTKQDADQQFKIITQKLVDLESRAKNLGISQEEIDNPDDNSFDFIVKISKNPMSYDKKIKIATQSLETTMALRKKQLEILNLKLSQAESQK